MRRVTATVPALAIALVLGACGPAVSSANFRTAPPRPPTHEIAVFATKLPTCPYDEIGVVRGKRRSTFNSLQQVLAAIQERAREMGGDAVVGIGQTLNVEGGIVLGDMVSVESQDGLAGTVIRFRDPTCVQ